MKFKIPFLWLLITPFLLYHLGEWLNILVISANHGVMPVMIPNAQWIMDKGIHPGAQLDEIHRVIQSNDHLKFLADIIQHNHAQDTKSIGDEFINLGEWLEAPMLGAWLAAIGLKTPHL